MSFIRKLFRSKPISKDDLNRNDIVILVVGTAGSGKTSFINTVAQKHHLSVDHTLSGSTKKVAHIRCTLKTGLSVVLVDTPPFPDDTGHGHEIRKWLKTMQFKVKGIVYLQPITAIRAKPEEDFYKLLLDVPTILTTTHWTKERNQTHESRMEELEASWRRKGIPGPPPRRYNNTPDASWDIVTAILTENGIVMQLQDESRVGKPLAKAKELSSKDVVIALMGPAGSGKSTFIEVVSGIEGIASHGLRSCTSSISVFRSSIPEMLDSEVSLVDTPGFDDTSKSDVEIFKLISDWVIDTYKKRIPLAGLLYFHRITDNVMAGSVLRNLRIIEPLCAEFSTIVLTTTMWDGVQGLVGVQRERQLQDEYWKSLIDRGASVRRFLGTRPSALEVLRPILSQVKGYHLR